MAQMQRVSWRTVGYAALGTTAIIAATIGIVHSDGVRPTSMKSSAATRWLVYQPDQLLVLADGLSGKVLAKIEAKSEATNEIAVQGAGGAFLVVPSQGTVRSISTANLQLGTPQVVSSLSDKISRDDLAVGTTGLTVVNTTTDTAHIVASGDVTRPIKVPKSDDARVARDGSMWLFTKTDVKHVGVDGTSKTFQLRGNRDFITTVGPHAVYIDHNARVVHWVEGGEVPVSSIPNAADAVLQTRGDDAPCVWMGTGSTLACIGKTGIDKVLQIDGLDVGGTDRLAVAGATAVVVHDGTNSIQTIDLDAGKLRTGDARPEVSATAKLTITSINGMIWIDEETGSLAWVVQQFGVQVIHKDDTDAVTVNAQGQITDPGSGVDSTPEGAGNAPGNDTEQDHKDSNGIDDPPKAIDDSVTARAGSTVTIPVTANDYDPDGNAIAVVSVGDKQKAGHGTVDVLNGTSVTYVPAPGFSGVDNFDYTIEDENGNPAHATVHLQLFPADSPNRAPIATPDRVQTRVGHAVTIDVLANDIDPERDPLSISTFGQSGSAKISETKGPTGLPALKYVPPDTPNVYTFSYQAADPQGGISTKTLVTVEVSGDGVPNQAPVSRPDAIRLPIGKSGTVDVKANDYDPDGDDLTIRPLTPPKGVSVERKGEQLEITLLPGAGPLSVVQYGLSDGSNLPEVVGRVLVVRVDNNAPNRPPVANPDTERVVVGNSVKIAVTANDADPEQDPIRLLSVTQPEGGVGTAAVEGNSNSVRFTPNLPNITEPTQVTFTYKINDGHDGNTAVGTVTVTVLVDALPRAPFARDDFADTTTDKPVIINVLANDSDPSGGSPHIVGDPVCTNGGFAKTNPDENVTFTPPVGLNATYRCKYKVANAQGLDAEAWIVITVTAPLAGNHDPTFLKGTALQNVYYGESLTLDASTFADDIDGDNLVFASMSKQGVGSTNFTQNTPSFRYTAPLPGTSDAAQTVVNLDVTISDGHNGYVPGTISIFVSSPPATPPAPLAHEIQRTTTLDLPVPPIDVLAELHEQNPGLTLSLLSATADSSSAPATIGNSGGIVRITPLAVGTISITYVVANAADVTQTASGKITVSVTAPVPVNPPPVAVDDVLTVSSGGTGSVDLLANDSGITEAGDKAVATLVNRPPASFGVVTLSNGVLTLVAATDGAEKHAVINYNLTDGGGTTVTGSVKLNILACSESAPKALSTTVLTGYQQPINIDLTQYALSGHVQPDSINGAGLTGPIGVYTPPAGKNDNEIVTFVVENGCHQTDNGVLTIDVNQPPVAGSVDRRLSQGDSLTLQVTELGSDPNNEALKVTALDGAPGWVSFLPGSINASPPAGTTSGLYTFRATIADIGGLTAIATINLTINNLPPTAVADSYTTDQFLYTFDPTLNDSDPEAGPLDVQVITPNDPSDQVVGRNGNQITVSIGHGVNRFDYTIVDSGGLTASSTITITSNRTPDFDNVSANTPDDSINITLSPIDPDGDPLSVTCSPPPIFQWELINDPDPSIPDQKRLHIEFQGFQGSAVFSCVATDTFGASAESQISLSIG